MSAVVAAVAVLTATGVVALQVRAGRDGFIAGLFSDVVGDDGPTAGGSPARQDDPAPYRTVTDSVGTVESPLSVVGTQPSADYQLTIDVDAPLDAVAIQVSTSPSMAATVRLPIQDTIDIPVVHAGYQMVFARFEHADGSLSPIWTVGGEVDPTYEAATSSKGGNPHRPSWVRPFSATELVVRVEAGRLQRGVLEAYDLDDPPAGDQVVAGGVTTVERAGAGYGLAVSARRDVIRQVDRLIGRPLDVETATGSPWMLSVIGDTTDTGGGIIEPDAIRHVSRPAGFGTGPPDDPWPREMVHDIVLSLSDPLVTGTRYRIEAAGSIAPIEFVYDPTVNRSPAVHVTQVGFSPGDEPKVAYLSGWFDGMGDTALPSAGPSPEFVVVDTSTRAVLFEGTGRLDHTDASTERIRDGELNQPGRQTGSPVYELDFTPVDSVGRYEVCVIDIGCSEPFSIDETVWRSLTETVARAAFHQRSGIGLGPPHTSFDRPRPYHPDDGFQVTSSDYSLLDARFDPDLFANLAAARTGDDVAGAWGGHFDAGDWDRRIYHLWFTRTAAQLVDRFPDRFEGLELNIPESGDAVPDLLDEALWSLDLYRRLQRDDGAVPGGIEASEHPQANTTSWVDDLAVYTYEPDPYASYIYAGVAAEVATVLADYDRERADDYLASAMEAMEWAEENQESDRDGDAAAAIAGQRTVAAAALLLATGDERWHELFVDTADFRGDGEPDLACHEHAACDAAWLYLQADEAVTDAGIRQEFVDRFARSADSIVEAAEANAYGWTSEHPGVPFIWGLGSGGAPHTSGLLKAYLVTGDERYRSAALRSALVAVGANPANRSMITGVGREPARNPLVVDVNNGGLPLWPGTPVYGHHDLAWSVDDDWITDSILEPAGASPDPNGLPYLWQWYDVSNVAAFNEFTLHQSHAEALWTFGVLAATVSGSNP